MHDNLATAAHEAGHAIVACCIGARVHYAAVGGDLPDAPPSEGDVLGLTVLHPSLALYRADLDDGDLFSMAGVAGEIVALHRPGMTREQLNGIVGTALWHATNDVSDLFGFDVEDFTALPPRGRKKVGRLVRDAQRLLVRNHRAFLAVTGLLAHAGYVHGDDVHALVEHHRLRANAVPK